MIGVIISQPIKEEQSFKVIDIEHKIKDADTNISKLVSNIEKAGAGAGALLVLLDKRVKEKESLENELSKLKQIPEVDPLNISEIPADILDYRKTELRTSIREKIFSTVKEIIIKTSNKHIEIKVELYTKNILTATVIQNKYLMISGTAIGEHLSDPGLGGTSTLIESLKWSGIDKKGNKFDLEVANNLDFKDEQEVWSEFLDVPLA